MNASKTSVTVALGALVLGAVLCTSKPLPAADGATGAPAVLPDTVSPPVDRARRLALLLRKLDRTARVLYVTAHPDDESSELIARLTHGDGVEVALLTLTRGEGGQNEIGSELFDALGVLRARELEAAHRYDGARQYFGRAFEFGYSFSVDETFERWGRRRTLRDIVQVIREFRPDVILTMWPTGDGGGQHHQASALLAVEAFNRAADADLWPELGPAHQATRLFRQLPRGRPGPEHAPLRCTFDVAGLDPVLGTTYAELGRAARGQHKCQGMVRNVPPFTVGPSHWEWFLAHGEKLEAVSHPLAGLSEPLLERAGEVTPLGQRIRALAAGARASYRVEQPAGCIDALLELEAVLHTSLDGTEDPGARVRLGTLRERVAETMLLALGVRIAARAPWQFASAGQQLPVSIALDSRAAEPVGLRVTVVGPVGCIAESGSLELAALPPRPERRELTVTLADTAPSTVPRAVPDTALAESPLVAAPWWGPFRVTGTFTVRERELALPSFAVSHDRVDPEFPALRNADLHVVPDPAVRPRHSVLALPFAAAAAAVSRDIEVLVSAQRPGPLQVELRAPQGWQVAPEQHTVSAVGEGREQALRFTVTGPCVAGRPRFTARVRRADPDARWSTAGYQVVDYPHIRRDALAVSGDVTVVVFPCQRPPVARRIGYVTGTGDEVVRCMADLGVVPYLLDAAALAGGSFEDLDVIVLGVRAYKVRDDLKAAHRQLMQWVDDGGVLIVQYNKLELNGPRDWTPGPWLPFPGARVWRDRVTDETAPIDVLLPDHPVFQRPNVIAAADWQDWVQERGLYFLDHPHGKYVDLLTTADPFPDNAGTKRGALVEARRGRGRWIYVGLGLFRQLPAGVPGGYRLLANLLSLRDER